MRAAQRARHVVATAVITTGAAMLTAQPAQAAGSADRTAPITVGVDHFDPATQNPNTGRLFEYTAFYGSTISVHSGQVVDFKSAPASFHIIGLSANPDRAVAVYPVAVPDEEKAPHGGLKAGLGTGNFEVRNGNLHGGGQISLNRPNGPPHCGGVSLHQAPCTFKGGDDVEIAGPVNTFGAHGPQAFDWQIKIDAPVGIYHTFCTIHPYMRGAVRVVPDNQPVSTQSQVDAAGAQQWAQDKHNALAAEAAANHVSWTGGAPGTRTYLYHIGLSTGDGRVAMDEMLPTTTAANAQHLVKGDKVKYVWADEHNIHSVMFSNNGFVPPFGFDCGATFSPSPCIEPGEGHQEFILDPGMASGAALTKPTAMVDSGVLIGKNYDVPDQVQTWSAVTNSATQSGLYTFHCMIHPFMHDELSIG